MFCTIIAVLYHLLFFFCPLYFFIIANMCSPGRGIRFAVGNAHSINNKRAGMDFLLHDRDIDVLCISESWLAEDVAFEFYVYLTYRRDRLVGGGGGGVGDLG